MGFGLAVVADNLEAANHLANGEEAETLGRHDATSNELDGTEVANLLDEVLGRLEDGAVLDRGPEVLVSGLEGSQGTVKEERPSLVPKFQADKESRRFKRSPSRVLNFQ